MNKAIKMMIAGLACVALCGTTLAAPHGGKGGRAPQKAPAHQKAPAPKAPNHGHTPVPAHHAANHRAPAPMHHARTAPPPRPHLGHPPPPRHHFRHHPVGARFWSRPPCPPPRFGALRAWAWVAAAWSMTIDGIYYYGDGYYYDGYNYYYNGAYYTTPPGTTIIVNQPEVVISL